MLKLVLIVVVAACCVSAAPKAGLAPLAYSAPLVAAAPVAYAAPAPAVVTAHSSQYIAQNFNGLAVAAAAPVLVLLLALAACCVSAAPKAGLAPLAYSTPLVAAAPAAYAAPAPAIVTAHSSQYIAQNFNGLAVAAAAPVKAMHSESRLQEAELIHSSARTELCAKRNAVAAAPGSDMHRAVKRSAHAHLGVTRKEE
ncbi:cuticle protein 38-like [Schistocerca cancellata]|uniref:cuticle protein 38-like n=1 Tax=Schistocerca cancellata TaxID=274614 RepID=UPI002117971E|nr:cuticle protein 38-like [Schistocerca cancellata]